MTLHATIPQMYRQECRHDDAVFYFLARSASNSTGWHRLYRSASVFNTSLIVPCLVWLITQSLTWHLLVGCYRCTLLCSLQGLCKAFFFTLGFLFLLCFFFMFCLVDVSVCSMHIPSWVVDSCATGGQLSVSARGDVMPCFLEKAYTALKCI